MLITDLLRKNAQNYPQEEALVALDSGSIRPFDDDAYAASRQSMTWKEFDEAANRVANYFHSIGIGPRESNMAWPTAIPGLPSSPRGVT